MLYIKVNYLVLLIVLSTCIHTGIYANNRDIISSIIKHNQQYLDLIDEHYFTNHNKPRITILTCSDSRIDMEFLNTGTIHDLFIVRNVGNQFDINKLSVEYGVRKMHTPILMILGHSDCKGATLAVQDKFDKYLTENDILKSTNDVIQNINKQTSLAIDLFKDLVNNRKLLVIGAIYDFNNDFKYGSGKLIIININGETDITLLKNSPYLKNIENIAFNDK